MEPFRYHVFVCTQEKPENVRSCSSCGSPVVLRALQQQLWLQGLADEVQVTTCGCFGLCDDAPIMVAYPEGAWYRKVRPEDVSEIVASHFRFGKIVTRLAWTDAPAMRAMALEHTRHYFEMVKAKEDAGILPDDINETIRGFMPSRALLTALELDLFTAVGSGASAAEVAQRASTDPRSTEALLNALVSLKLLEKNGQVFSRTPRSSHFLAEDSRDSARSALIHIADLWNRWSALTECVRTGMPAKAEPRDESSQRAFIAAMDRNAREGAVAVVREAGANGIRNVLDLGGGSGAYAVAFAKAVPELRAKVIELPEIAPLTREYIRRSGVQDRIIVQPGNMLTDPLGENYDLILLSSICHMFSPQENQGLFQRAHAALSPAGRLIIRDFILEPDKTAPRFATLFSLNMLVGTENGSSYSEPEYASWMRRAGFTEVRRVRVPGPSGLMIAA